MDRIQGPGATVDHKFTEGNPATNTPATTVTAVWLNAAQEELVSMIEAAGITPTNADLTQLQQALAVLGGGRASLRNLFVNGSFDISARKGITGSYSVNAAALEQYTLDRFFYQADAGGGGTGAATLVQSAHTIGQTVVPGSPRYFAHIVQGTSASLGAPRFGQRIEDVTQFSGQPITVSLWLQATAPLSASLKVTQNFGSGGSSAVALTPVALSVGTGWTRFQATFTPASISGKALGNGHNLQVELILPQGSTFTINVSQWQVELGAIATPYERRDLALTLWQCRRYFEASTPDNLAAGTAGDIGITVLGYDVRVVRTRFQVRKRAVPAMTWYSSIGPAPNTAGQISWDNPSNPSGANAAVTAVNGTTEFHTGYPVCASLDTSTLRTFGAQWAADAEL